MERKRIKFCLCAVMLARVTYTQFNVYLTAQSSFVPRQLMFGNYSNPFYLAVCVCISSVCQIDAAYSQTSNFLHYTRVPYGFDAATYSEMCPLSIDGIETIESNVEIGYNCPLSIKKRDRGDLCFVCTRVYLNRQQYDF